MNPAPSLTELLHRAHIRTPHAAFRLKPEATPHFVGRVAFRLQAEGCG